MELTVDRAPTVEALRDEKDPTVRSYLENLRGQVATIAARYGVNARDVFRAGVQDRMEVDDLAAVAGLVKRIGMFSEKAVGSKESVEFGRELERRERRAEEMLERAQGIGMMPSQLASSVGGQIVKWYLRAGLVDRAYRDALRADIRLDPQLIRDVRLAAATAWAKSNPALSEKTFAQELQARKNPADYLEGYRNIIALFDARYPLLSDANFLLERQDIWQIASPFRPIAIERFLIELRRRGLDESTVVVSYLRTSIDECFRENRSLASSMSYNLALAELRAAHGMDASEQMGKAVDWVIGWVRDRRPEEAEIEKKIGPIARTAGRIGADASVDALQDLDPAYRHEQTLVVQRELFKGWIDAKRFDKALEDVRFMKDSGKWLDLIVALYDDNQIERAERFYLEIIGDGLEELRMKTFAIAAHARRGENVLDLAEARAVEFAGNKDSRAAQALASAAIATIGFTTAMKRRLAERD